MKSAKEINKEWGGKMLTSLTIQDAAIVFCLGIKANGDIAVSQTSDIMDIRSKEAIQRSIDILTEQLLKMA